MSENEEHTPAPAPIPESAGEGAPDAPKVYSADSITVLEGLEAVRVRPAMYIGDTDSRGMHHLIWEVVDNAVDEALAGHASRCKVILRADGSVRVEDDGRGIPVSIHKTEGVPAVEVVLTKLHAGGKFDDESYKVSGGLHGVGVSCVNALATRLHVAVHKDGKVHEMEFARGKKTRDLEVTGDTDKTGTVVTWTPDASIFSTVEVDYEIVEKRLRETAYLMGTRGLRIELEDERNGASEVFEYPEGLKTFVRHINKNKSTLHRRRRALHEDRARARRSEERVRGRARAPVHGFVPRERVHVREQHQHARRRYAPRGTARRADENARSRTHAAARS